MVQHTIPTTFNSQKNNFNEIFLFQNSPVQPIALESDLSVSVTCSAIAWPRHDKRIIHLLNTRLLNYGGLPIVPYGRTIS
jgi:hypothetical protein